MPWFSGILEWISAGWGQLSEHYRIRKVASWFDSWRDARKERDHQWRNPDEAFSKVPYEKGFNFLYFLENITNSESNIDLFRKILREYFDKFKYLSINAEDFKTFFVEKIKEELPDKSSEILDKIDWIKWLDAPGFPPIKNDFSNKYVDEIENYISLFYDNNLPDTFVDIFKGWNHLLRQYFLNTIKDTDRELDDYQLSYLSNTLNLKEGYNVE